MRNFKKENNFKKHKRTNSNQTSLDNPQWCSTIFAMDENASKISLDFIWIITRTS